MKIVTVVGARPQFIKAAAVSRAIDRYNHNALVNLHDVLVHTGQHYDQNMSQVFFDQLDIPRPDYNLEIGSASHGTMTGRMLERIEKVLMDEQPDWVLIYGDTNSTLAGALAAVKLHLPVAHVEAGLRSFNMRMPEEVNRILSDRVSSLLFCPTRLAVENLEKENITRGVHLVGDVMYDACLLYREKAAASSHILEQYGLEEKRYVLATCHRAENTDDPDRLGQIVAGLGALAEEAEVVFPVHPRTRKILADQGLVERLNGLKLLYPVAYLDMIQLEHNAQMILTDSGGIQKEAFFFSIPCLTLRDETEWRETVDSGANILVGANQEAIIDGYRSMKKRNMQVSPADHYGAGNASDLIVSLLETKREV